MASPTSPTSPKNLARIAGLLYFLQLGAAFNELYVLPHIVKSGAAAATTADDIRASTALFRAGLVGDLLTAVLWLLTAMALYQLLKHVHQAAAAAMVVFASVGAAIQFLNQLNQYTALTVATSADYGRAFGRSGSDGLVLLFTGMQHSGYVIDSMFFGLWLLPLGYLVFRSGYFPRALGVLLMIGCFSYIAALFQIFAPGAGANTVTAVIAPGGIAELSFLLWLLVKGVKIPSPDAGGAPGEAPGPRAASGQRV